MKSHPQSGGYPKRIAKGGKGGVPSSGQKRNMTQSKAFEIVLAGEEGDPLLGCHGLSCGAASCPRSFNDLNDGSPQNNDSEEENFFDESPIPGMRGMEELEDDIIQPKPDPPLSNHSIEEANVKKLDNLMQEQEPATPSKTSSSSQESPVVPQRHQGPQRKISDYLIQIKKRARNHRSKKKKYLDLYEEHMELRYILYYADDIVQHGIQTKCKVLYHQMIGDITESFDCHYLGFIDDDFKVELCEKDGIFFVDAVKPNSFNFYKDIDNKKQLTFFFPFLQTPRSMHHNVKSPNSSFEDKKQASLKIETCQVNNDEKEFRSPTFKTINEQELKIQFDGMKAELVANASEVSDLTPQTGDQKATVADIMSQQQNREGQFVSNESLRIPILNKEIEAAPEQSEDQLEERKKEIEIHMDKSSGTPTPTDRNKNPQLNSLGLNFSSLRANSQDFGKYGSFDPNRQMQRMRKLSQHILENYESPNIGDIEQERRRQTRLKQIQDIDRKMSIKPLLQPSDFPGRGGSSSFQNYQFNKLIPDQNHPQEESNESCSSHSLKKRHNSSQDLSEAARRASYGTNKIQSRKPSQSSMQASQFFEENKNPEDSQLKLRLTQIESQIDENSEENNPDYPSRNVTLTKQGTDLEQLQLNAKAIGSESTHEIMQHAKKVLSPNQQLKEHMRMQLKIETNQKKLGFQTSMTGDASHEPTLNNKAFDANLYDDVRLFRMSEPKSGLLKKQAFIGFKNSNKEKAFRRSVIKPADRFNYVSDFYKTKDTHSDLNMSMQSESGSDSDQLNSDSHDLTEEENPITLQRMQSLWVKCPIGGKKMQRLNKKIQGPTDSTENHQGSDHGSQGDNFSHSDNVEATKLPELSRHKTSTYQNVTAFKSMFFQQNYSHLNKPSESFCKKSQNLGLKKLETDIQTTQVPKREKSVVISMSVKKSIRLNSNSHTGDKSLAQQASSEIQKNQALARELKRQRKREIRQLKKVKKRENKEEAEDRLYIKRQVKALRGLKKLCESLKGHPITGDCYEEEEGEDVSRTDFDGTKSEITQNMNMIEPQPFSQIPKIQASKDNSASTPNRNPFLFAPDHGQPQVSNYPADTGFRLSKASQCKSENNIIEENSLPDQPSSTHMKSAVAGETPAIIPATVIFQETEQEKSKTKIEVDKKKQSRRQTLNVTDGLSISGFNMPKQFDLEIEDLNFSHGSKKSISQSDTMSHAKSHRNSIKEECKKGDEAQRTLLSRVADQKAMEYIREKQRSAQASSQLQNSSQEPKSNTGKSQMNMFLDHLSKDTPLRHKVSTQESRDNPFEKASESAHDYIDHLQAPQNLRQTVGEETKTSYGLMHMKTAKFNSNINSPGRIEAQSQLSSKNLSEPRDNIFENLITGTDQTDEGANIPTRQTGVSFQITDMHRNQMQDESRNIEYSIIEEYPEGIGGEQVFSQRMEVEDESQFKGIPRRLDNVIEEEKATEGTFELRNQERRNEAEQNFKQPDYESQEEEESKQQSNQCDPSTKVSFQRVKPREISSTVRVIQNSRNYKDEMRRQIESAQPQFYPNSRNEQYGKIISNGSQCDDVSEFSFKKSPLNFSRLPDQNRQDKFEVSLSKLETFSFKKIESPNINRRGCEQESAYSLSKISRASQPNEAINDSLSSKPELRRTLSSQKKQPEAQSSKRRQGHTKGIKFSLKSCLDEIERNYPEEELYSINLSNIEKQTAFFNDPFTQKAVSLAPEKRSPALLTGQSSSLSGGLSLVQKASSIINNSSKTGFLSKISGKAGKYEDLFNSLQAKSSIVHSATPSTQVLWMSESFKKEGSIKRGNIPNINYEMFEIKEEPGRTQTRSSNYNLACQMKSESRLDTSILSGKDSNKASSRRAHPRKFTHQSSKHLNMQKSSPTLQIFPQTTSMNENNTQLPSFDQLIIKDFKRSQTRQPRYGREREIVVDSDSDRHQTDPNQSQMSIPTIQQQYQSIKPFDNNLNYQDSSAQVQEDMNRASLPARYALQQLKQFSESPFVQIQKEKSEQQVPIQNLINKKGGADIQNPSIGRQLSPPTLKSKRKSIDDDLDELQSIFSRHPSVRRNVSKRKNATEAQMKKNREINAKLLILQGRKSASISKMEKNYLHNKDFEIANRTTKNQKFSMTPNGFDFSIGSRNSFLDLSSLSPKQKKPINHCTQAFPAFHANESAPAHQTLKQKQQYLLDSSYETQIPNGREVNHAILAQISKKDKQLSFGPTQSTKSPATQFSQKEKAAVQSRSQHKIHEEDLVHGSRERKDQSRNRGINQQKLNSSEMMNTRPFSGSKVQMSPNALSQILQGINYGLCDSSSSRQGQWQKPQKFNFKQFNQSMLTQSNEASYKGNGSHHSQSPIGSASNITSSNTGKQYRQQEDTLANVNPHMDNLALNKSTRNLKMSTIKSDIQPDLRHSVMSEINLAKVKLNQNQSEENPFLVKGGSEEEYTGTLAGRMSKGKLSYQTGSFKVPGPSSGLKEVEDCRLSGLEFTHEDSVPQISKFNSYQGKFIPQSLQTTSKK